MRRALFILLLFTWACGSSSSTDPTPPPADVDWNYFDRQVYLPSGISVTPESSAAQEQVKLALRELEIETDLGTDFFIIANQEDSLLQPVAAAQTLTGREWLSFIQIWSDDVFNDYVASEIGVLPDPDMIVAENELNQEEYFMIFRESCFLAGETCQFASQQQAKSMVWRGFGYLMKLRSGDESTSAVMTSGHTAAHVDVEQRRRFFAEFNQALEKRKLGLPEPE